MSINFCPIASGSDGNSVYIGDGKTHILVDAGLSGKRIECSLDAIGVSASMLNGIFITHEHLDHILGVGVLSRRHNIPVFATQKTWLRIDRHNMLGKINPYLKHIVSPGDFCTLGDINVKPFSIPHDAADPVGYSVETYECKVCVATDIGHVTNSIKEAIASSNILLIESNHDIEMLENGKYPRELKTRVSGLKGHLSNVSCGQLLAEIMSGAIKHVYLGHLSEENNRPIIAMDTVARILEANKIIAGKHLNLCLANRGAVSPMISI